MGAPELLRCEKCDAEVGEQALFCPMCGAPRTRRDGDPLLGEVIADRYLLKERLGHGGSGTIYLAEHVTLRRQVAVKILHHELAKDELAVERFRREATMVSQLENEHIVQVHDFGRALDGRLFLAMEHLEGETLSSKLEREKMVAPEVVVDVITQLAEALAEAHALGVVHRDLRPRNVFLAKRRGKDGFVKVLDFGLAKLVERGGDAASTSLGMTFGDPRYMSPEAARGEALDRRADIYSMGVIAYEMLTGAPPFAGERVGDLLDQHAQAAPRPIVESAPETPPALAALIHRLLAKRPGDRLATCLQVVNALKDPTQPLPPPEEIVVAPVVAEPAAATPVAAEPVATEPVSDPGATMKGVAVAAIAPPPEILPPQPVEAPSIVAVPTESPLAEPSTPSATGMLKQEGSTGEWYARGDGLDEDVGAVTRQLELEERADARRRLMYAGGGVGILAAIVLLAIVWPREQKAAPDAAEVAKKVEVDAARVAAVAVAAPPDAAPIARTAPPDATVVATPEPKPEPEPEKTVAKKPPEKKPPEQREPVVKKTTVKKTTHVVDTNEPEATVRTKTPAAEAAQAEFYVKLGQKALREHKLADAVKHFDRARSFDPSSADALAGLGDAALRRGASQDAIVHLTAASRLAPRSGHIQTLLGQASLALGKKKDAEMAFKRALALDPHDAQASQGLEAARK